MAVTVKSNVKACISAKDQAVALALEIIGGMAESYAKGLTPVDTGALRNSMAHQVDRDKQQVVIGSNMEYAPYVELGTGKLYDPPPEWIQAHTARGRGRGLDRWFYVGNDGKWHVGYPRTGVHMLQRAITDHIGEYKNVLNTELSK